MLKTKRTVAAFLITCLLVSISMLSVNGVTDLSITGGPLAIEELGLSSLNSVLLDGTTQTTSYADASVLTLTDASGTGNGWILNLSATQFTNATALHSSLKTLSLNSLALGGVSIVVAEEGSSAANDGITITTSGTIDNDGATGINIITAAANKGMGTYTVTINPMTLTLLPKEVKAGTYISTIKVTLTAGPQI